MQSYNVRDLEFTDYDILCAIQVPLRRKSKDKPNIPLNLILYCFYA
jgi:hypothetical protein